METTPQQRLAQVVTQMQHAALPVIQAYVDRQAELQLDQVLSEARLSSDAGLLASLDALDRFEQLIAENHATWQRIILELTRQVTAVLADFPEDERDETVNGMLASLQEQLAAQHRSLAARADWIDAGRIICRLVQRGRALEPDATVPVFATDADIDELHRQLARIQAAAEIERVLQEQRLARIRHNFELMQSLQ
jgi:hypothetical protein